MQCAFCGHEASAGETQCPRCGGAIAAESSAVDQVYSSADTDPSTMSVPAVSPDSFGPADPESELRTQMVSLGDRQESLETKMVELPPPTAAPPPEERRGLPDSRVARGVEDLLLDVKRLLYRLGRVGRLSFYSHMLVIIGSVSPWIYVPHQGYTPGVESWGGLPLGLSLLGCVLLWWRFKRTVSHKVLPVVLHLLVGALLVLVMLWRYQETQEVEAHLRPTLAFGFYVSGLGALGVMVGGLIGLKDVR